MTVAYTKFVQPVTEPDEAHASAPFFLAQAAAEAAELAAFNTLKAQLIASDFIPQPLMPIGDFYVSELDAAFVEGDWIYNVQLRKR